ncbi:DnaJ domain-containing protein [Chryseolinea sp. H1M3-3]|uniref:J domain-containing protein n=1 Tax=Chryseolinea sp. H1M3-3 TaxID=3034144 RepID=UPI0023EDF1AD|nr:DnaJ domain-containing protein [Chryseolinea sp. H1M3-3]
MNPYEVLGLTPAASDAEIKAAYRELVKIYHPDITNSPDPDRIRNLNEAYDILSDPVRKYHYDSRSKIEPPIPYEESPIEAYGNTSTEKEKREEKRGQPKILS